MESSSEDETEKEAIQLIQSQQEQIAELKAEIAQKQSEMVSLESMQMSQTETYKSQISNLKK